MAVPYLDDDSPRVHAGHAAEGASTVLRLARQLHLPELIVVAIGGHPFPIVWAIVGGIVLVAISHLLMRQRRFADRY